MFVIDNGDAIRGIAEVASKLDFTVNGYVGTTATQLADGQLSNAEADLYASSADATVVTSITVVNTDSVARTFTLYLKPSGGTSRAISPVSLDLGIGHSFYTDGQRIAVMDASGQILSTWAVDDSPVDGETDKPISSNYAYDFRALYDAHIADSDAHMLHLWDKMVTGQYYATPLIGKVTLDDGALTADRLYAVCFPIVKDLDWDRIAIQVATLDAGSSIRLGIYDDDGTLNPGALSLDAGVVSSATTGLKEISLPSTRSDTKGTVIWLAMVSDGVPRTRMVNSYGVGLRGSTDGIYFYPAVHRAFAYDALPDPLGGTPTGTYGHIQGILLRKA